MKGMLDSVLCSSFPLSEGEIGALMHIAYLLRIDS